MKTIHPAIAENAMEENERLRGLLRDTASVAITMLYDSHKDDVLAEFKLPELEAVVEASRHLQDARVERVYRAAWDAALSQQAEPTDTFTAVDMATAAAQGFRDGQAAVEPAPAQDEREAEAVVKALLFSGRLVDSFLIRDICKAVLATRPAQTEQHPIGWFTDDHLTDKSATTYDREVADRWRSKGWPVNELYAAPIAQTAPQPEQSGLVEALKRIWRLMADREAQALDGSQDRQLFVTILNIADAALSPSIPADYSCDYAGCSSKAHPGTSLCLAHHSPKDRAALSTQRGEA